VALYVPRPFAADPALAWRLIDGHPFAMLVTPAGREPYVTHLPLLRDGDALLGHVARANPHWRSFADAPSLAIFTGPHAYVSPTWYEAPHDMVPTWNFTAVHVSGRVDVLPGVSDRERVLEALVARFEDDDERAWRFAMTGKRRDAMLDGIVAFRMAMTRMDVKLKLSQNRTDEDRRRVADALAGSADAEARATAAWMRLVGLGDDAGR
jgi:transcriptional regulator